MDLVVAFNHREAYRYCDRNGIPRTSVHIFSTVGDNPPVNGRNMRPGESIHWVSGWCRDGVDREMVELCILPLTRADTIMINEIEDFEDG